MGMTHDGCLLVGQTCFVYLLSR